MIRTVAYGGVVVLVLLLAVLWPTRNTPRPEPSRSWRPTRGLWLLRRKDR